MERRLAWFIGAWIVFAIAVNTLAILGIVSLAPTSAEGRAHVIEILSLPNVLPYLAEILLFAPALVALSWRRRLHGEAADTPYGRD